MRHLFWLCTIAVVSPTVLSFDDTSQSNDMRLELTAFSNQFDAGGNDKFERGGSISLQYVYELSSWLAADASFYISEKMQDEVRQDIVGSYRVSMATKAVLLGLRPQHKFTGWQVYGRLGILGYDTELEVEEYFDGSIPGDIDSARAHGTGYYAGIGVANFITDRITMQFEYNRMTQLDLFKGSSDSPFDLQINSISIGCGMTF